MNDVLFAIVLLGYFVVAIAWPTLRMWRHHGVWPIVFDRAEAPAQRLVGALLVALFAGLLALAGAYATVGSAALAVWTVPAPVRTAGWLALFAGTLLTIVAQQQMGASLRIGIDDRPTPLVTAGLFRVIRNPIFSGMLLFVAGVAALSPAWWSLAAWAATVVGIRMQVALEERHLIALHGAGYLDYASRVGRFVPLAGRLRALPAAPGAARSTGG